MVNTMTTAHRPALALVFMLAVLLLAGGCRGSASDPVHLTFASMKLALATEPAAPRVGANALRIEVVDAAGVPLDGVAVEARVAMPAMGAMAAMGGPAAITPEGGGRFRADFELAMGGTWQVEVEVRRSDAPPARATGTLTVGAPGLRLAASGGGAAGPDLGTGTGTESSTSPGEIEVPLERLQKVGVTTVAVTRRSLPSRVLAVGRVVAPESEQVDVSLKVGGWATKVEASALGARVERGSVLFEVYSPELLTAQQEYLEALRSQSRAHGTSAPDRADDLVLAARSRLARWDFGPRELARLEATREPWENVPIRSPVTGFVVEKNLVQGGAFERGERLFRIAPLAKIWIEADVQETDLGRVGVGDRAHVRLSHAPGAALEARVVFLQPMIDPTTRTARLRLEVDNPDLALRPNAYAEVEVEGPAAAALVVPESAVLETGERSFVFRALGAGRFRPQPVAVGRRVGDAVEIVSGLAEGDEIVASGTFLIAAESRLRAALEQWR